ncbi:MAG TPA: RNA-binding protein [Stellaceae bacterium]|jgi:RNA recognition motif-containing protein|nr:RNA-binding protein [Stellaceae bacterium]
MRAAPFKGNIVVTNMPENFTGSALAALFDDFGLVLGAVIEHPNGDAERAPRGLVSLAPPSAVETAIQSLDGQVIDSRHLKVRKAPEPKKRPPGAAKPGAQARRPPRMDMPRAAAPGAASMADYAPAQVVVRRAPIVERRSLGAPTKRVRFFDESKNTRG